MTDPHPGLRVDLEDPYRGTTLPKLGRENTNPTRPHLFRETNDPGVVAFAGGGATESGSQLNMLATATSAMRATRCALPGCGRPRPDPIHAADED